MASTPPAPSGPHSSLPQLQAVQGDNEVIFLRNVHLEDSPVGELAANRAGKAGPGERRGRRAAGKVGAWRACRRWGDLCGRSWGPSRCL